MTNVIWPALAIDGVTATLLLVAVLPWLQPLFKSLELPGGVKVEFQDLEDVAKRAAAVGLIAKEAPAPPSTQYSFMQVATSDPNLALAGLRIELERRLEQLAQASRRTFQVVTQILYLDVRQAIDEFSARLQSATAATSAEYVVAFDDWVRANEEVIGRKGMPTRR